MLCPDPTPLDMPAHKTAPNHMLFSSQDWAEAPKPLADAKVSHNILPRVAQRNCAAVSAVDSTDAAAVDADVEPFL